jgi:hypothetical protein
MPFVTNVTIHLERTKQVMNLQNVPNVCEGISVYQSKWHDIAHNNVLHVHSCQHNLRGINSSSM